MSIAFYKLDCGFFPLHPYDYWKGKIRINQLGNIYLSGYERAICVKQSHLKFTSVLSALKRNEALLKDSPIGRQVLASILK